MKAQLTHYDDGARVAPGHGLRSARAARHQRIETAARFCDRPRLGAVRAGTSRPADQHAERRPVAGALARRTPPHEKSENVRGRKSPLLPTAIFSLEIRVLLFLQDVSPNVSPAHDATRYQRGPLVPVFPH